MRTKLIAIFTLALCGVGFSQDPMTDYRLTLEVSRLIWGDIPISFEKVLGKRATIGLNAAYRFSTKESGTMENNDIGPFRSDDVYDYLRQNYSNRFYNAFTGGIHFKYYFRDKRTFFIEPNFYYRYWYFNDKDVEFTEQTNWDNQPIGYSYDGIRTEEQRDMAFHLNFGRTIHFDNPIKHHYVMDVEIGIGMVDRSYEFYTLQGMVEGVPVRDYREKGYGKYPILKFGLTFGMEW